jgi:tetratricopeptide (TPR) repeat protein
MGRSKQEKSMTATDLERLRQAVQVHPEDQEARLALLRALVAGAYWQEAEEVGNSLRQQETASLEVHTLLTVVYAKQERVQEAIQQCQQALTAHPDDTLLLFNLGTLLAQQGENDAAQETLAKAVTQHDGWAELHYNLGIVLLRQERYKEALDAFERAAALREDDAEAHFSCGNVHAMKGLEPNGSLDYYEIDCAIHAYKRAIQHRPGYTAALYNLGMLYGRMGSAEGRRVWEQYLEAAKSLDTETTWRMRAQEYQRDLEDRLR